MARPPCSPPSSRPRREKPGIDFFPLTVNYQEKTYAAGKIPGGYFKREGRPTERKRWSPPDRPPDPPAVPRRLRNETQVIATVLSARPRERSRHPGDGRRLGRADALRRALHGPDRRGARRLHQRRVRAQPDDRRDEGSSSTSSSPAPGRRADGRIGSQGAFRRHHARRRHVRPPRLPAGDRRDHQAWPRRPPRSRATSSRRTTPL
jgi:hypothetical protein